MHHHERNAQDSVRWECAETVQRQIDRVFRSGWRKLIVLVGSTIQLIRIKI